MKTLTKPDYWEGGYRRKDAQSEPLPSVEGFRSAPTRRMLTLLESSGIEGKNVLEVGAGDSDLLLLLADRHAGKARFSGLDYTDTGCELLRSRAQKFQLNVDVIKADLFQPPADLRGRFDVVYSMGLVEHFSRLEEVLVGLAAFLKPEGLLISIIPNMHGILGTLTKRWNRAVYDIHNPHGLRSFLDGHAKANLDVLRSGYLCSTNFGVLSSCFVDGQRGYGTYVQLSRLSKLVWWLESKTGREWPKTARFSPYIYAVSRGRSAPVSESSAKETSVKAGASSSLQMDA